MKIQSFILLLKERFKKLWEYKIFKIAVVIHGAYFLCSIILTLLFFRNLNDFRIYYEVGGVALRNINDLYTTPYDWPFRYLPLVALFFIPFHLMGFDLGFIVFNSLNLIINIFICMVLYKIIMFIKAEDDDKDEKKVITYISIYLMSLPNFFNYILGQINLYVTLLILLSLFIYLKYRETKWELLASFLLGISIIIKPITIFMIPFILIIHYDLKNRKLEFSISQSLVRLFGVLIPIAISSIMFLLVPDLLDGFVAANFTSIDPSQINHSFSITKLIINFLYLIEFTEQEVLQLQMSIFLIITVIFSLIGFISFIVRRNTTHSLIYGYCYGILIMFLCYFDSWNHHLLNLIPLLIIIIFDLTRHPDLIKKYIKPSLIFISFFDLAFMGLFFVIEDLFPFNFGSTIFLLLLFYFLVHYSIMKKEPN